MGCKHEGGTDRCVRSKNGECVVRSRDYKRNYQRKNSRSSHGVKNSLQAGYIGELLVAADLNYRCGRAYPNPVPQTPDDVYAKTSLGWRTVQVKVGRVNRKTGTITPHHRKRITSQIIAAVDIHNRRVRYFANGGKLPAELPRCVADICSTFVMFASEKEASRFHSTNFGATAAKRKPKKSSASRKRKSSSAKRAARNSRS